MKPIQITFSIKTISFLVLISLASNSFSQKKYKEMMNDNSINFYDVCKEADKYFTTHHKGKGSGWKGYQRWRANNESKFAPSGIRDNFDPLFVSNAYKNIVRKSPQVSRAIYSGWKDLGPYRIDSISGAYSTGLGRVVASYVHKANVQIMYVGSRSGGFWKSTNGGTTWKGTTDTLPASGVGTITAKPTNSNYVLIGVQNGGNTYSHGIYRSLDGGDSWAKTNFNPTVLGKGGLGSSFRINVIKYHPRVANLVFVATNDGLYRSTNNLTSWTRITSVNSNIKQIDFHPTNNNIIYIYRTSSSSDRNKVYRSLDQGLNFTSSATIPGNSGRTGYFSVSTACADCFYFASTNGVWISKDTAKTFTFLSNPPQSCLGFAVNDLDTSKMVYGYVDVETTNDGGRTFNQVSWWSLGSAPHGSGSYQHKLANSGHYIHADLHPAISVNGVYYVGTDGFFAKSSNNGSTWQIIGQGIGTRENYSLGASQSNHYRSISGSQDNGTSIKHKTTWIEFNGGDGMEGIIHPLNDNWMIGSFQFGSRFRTKDGGQTKQGVTPPGQGGSGNGYWEAPLVYDPNNQMRIYNFSYHVYKSKNFGTTWDSIGSPSFSSIIKRATIAENNSNIIVACSGSKIEKSMNGGATWVNIKNNLPNYQITDVVFNPKNDNNIFVTYNRYQNDGKKIYYTTNGGITWGNITHNLGNMPIRDIAVDHLSPQNLYVGTEIGVYTMPIGGTAWTLYNPGLPNSAIKELEIVNGSNTIRAAIWGRGLYEYSLVGRLNYPAILTTRITDMPTDDKPKKGVEQFVTSVISYSNTISSTYVKWSINSPTFDSIINMTNTVDSTWVSNKPLPDYPVGTKMYFKVYTIGNSNDTTETYKFMYKIKPFTYCQASGTATAGNLYIKNVTIKSINNNTTNNGYTYYAGQVLNLKQDSTYSISVECNTGWSSNKMAAWIDFDRDASFGDPENIGMSTIASKISTATFTVPTFANTTDTVRLRVRLYYYGTIDDPCGNKFGEVEDYPVLITGTNTSIHEENKNELNISVYPNPTNGEFTLNLENKINTGTVKIYNNLGKLVLEKDILNENKVNLNLNTNSNGFYFVHVQSKTRKSVIKIIKN